MKSITYEEFMKLNPGWLKDGCKAKLMEEIGRSKEKWTALDVLSIDHKEVSDRDKLLVLVRTELLTDKQARMFYQLIVVDEVSRLIESFKKKADEKTKDVFNKLVDFAKLNRFVYIGYIKILDTNDHTANLIMRMLGECYNKLLVICEMLQTSSNLPIVKIDDGVNDTLIAVYIQAIINTMSYARAIFEVEIYKYLYFYLKVCVGDRYCDIALADITRSVTELVKMEENKQ